MKKTMKIKIALAIALFVVLGFTMIAASRHSSHSEMIGILDAINKKNDNIENPFNPEAKLAYFDSVQAANPGMEDMELLSTKAGLLIEQGKEKEAVELYNKVKSKLDFMTTGAIMGDAAIAYMRLGERSNCVLNHGGTSCIFPIKDEGVHTLQTGSKNAIESYKMLLKIDPYDLESRWLLNVAYMTLGQYPKEVPEQWLIPGLDAMPESNIKPFNDVAKSLGLDVKGRAGGVVADDFNRDGYIDVITSGWDLSDPMHYFQNNKNGTFTDITAQSGLQGINGGLNIQQTDYNNDGFPDLFVLRGAWLTKGFGDQPSSLLRNNGDGTFTDVTTQSGLLFFHPTQTATWADFNNDGWLDVFIGMESTAKTGPGSAECALYINSGTGFFTNVAAAAHCNINAYVKGVTSADYDHDGLMDIFISTMNGKKFLLKNKGVKAGQLDFEDATVQAGIDANRERTFTTWFYDYNNDGWQDILVGDYKFDHALSYYAAAEALGKPVPTAGNMFLYKNNHDGTFTDVTAQTGLNKVVYSMGGNFGDIDNDGYPDMYLGTGNPDFKSLVPNKMFRNVGGERFEDVTSASRMGNLQKGHGIAFADFRNNGTQDIYAEMGGAYIGDSYISSLYLNPGQSNNNWISLKLEGVKANKAGIGSHIKLTFTENGVQRSVYKDVNSGGSFGASPLQQEIGIGQAKVIDEIEITWAGSRSVQRFKHVKPNQFLSVTEGSSTYKTNILNKLTFKYKPAVPLCLPGTTAKLN